MLEFIKMNWQYLILAWYVYVVLKRWGAMMECSGIHGKISTYKDLWKNVFREDIELSNQHSKLFHNEWGRIIICMFPFINDYSFVKSEYRSTLKQLIEVYNVEQMLIKDKLIGNWKDDLKTTFGEAYEDTHIAHNDKEITRIKKEKREMEEHSGDLTIKVPQDE